MKGATMHGVIRSRGLELEMRSLFESDKVKQKGLADFM